MKHPIVGDPIYGQKEVDVLRFLDKEINIDERIRLGGASRLLLHANELEFDLDAKVYHIVSDENFVKTCLKSM